MNSGLNLDLFDLPMCDVGCVELSTFLYLISPASPYLAVSPCLYLEMLMTQDYCSRWVRQGR